MIELRWLEQETGKRLMNEWGYLYQETTKTLQYRQKISLSDYSRLDESGSGGFVMSDTWTEWQDVPTVLSSNKPI